MKRECVKTTFTRLDFKGTMPCIFPEQDIFDEDDEELLKELEELRCFKTQISEY
jgi:hypothetical protein